MPKLQHQIKQQNTRQYPVSRERKQLIAGIVVLAVLFGIMIAVMIPAVLHVASPSSQNPAKESSGEMADGRTEGSNSADGFVNEHGQPLDVYRSIRKLQKSSVIDIESHGYALHKRVKHRMPAHAWSKAKLKADCIKPERDSIRESRASMRPERAVSI